jgi:alkylation response protein AidB-like acyl-CoA dehydrogenase
MDLEFNESQAAFQDLVRDFFEKESPPSVVRSAEPLGFDLALWRKLAAMGLHSITVAEARGGGGAGLLELAIAAEQLGRCLAPVPLVEAAVSAQLLASVPEVAESEQVVAGDLLATLALHPAVGDVARLVPAGAIADLVVTLRGEELLLLRQPTGPNRPAQVVPNLGAMPLADCRIDHADSVSVLARGPEAAEAHRRTVRQWEMLTAAALVGLGTKALDLALEYVMQRRAFGVLIGSFQTIQHRLADNVTALDGARLLAYEAAWASDTGQLNAEILATMAFLFATETSFKTAAESLQFHGGYGYTLEYDIQLYFRRARAWPLLAGDPRPKHAELAHRLYGHGEV